MVLSFWDLCTDFCIPSHKRQICVPCTTLSLQIFLYPFFVASPFQACSRRTLLQRVVYVHARHVRFRCIVARKLTFFKVLFTPKFFFHPM